MAFRGDLKTHIDEVSKAKEELWETLYTVHVPPEVIERLRPLYEATGMPPDTWVGVLAYRFTQLDIYTRHIYLEPFLRYELFCEESGPESVLHPAARRVISQAAETYMVERYGYYGEAGSIIREAGAEAPPRDLAELGSALERLLPLAAADFLHDMREFLVDFMGETHYETSRPGGLMKLGFYAYSEVRKYTTGVSSQLDMLNWLGSVITKSPGGPLCRQAVYVWPWLKRWLLETYINIRCDEYADGSVGSVAIDAADIALKTEFLTALASLYIQSDCIYVERGYAAPAGIFRSPEEGFFQQCKFLRAVHPMDRFMELLHICTEPVRDRCRAVAERYGERYGLRPRDVRILEDDCRVVLSTIFRDAEMLAMFVGRYIYAPPAIWPRAVSVFYRELEERTGLPRWRRWRVFRALRTAGEIP